MGHRPCSHRRAGDATGSWEDSDGFTLAAEELGAVADARVCECGSVQSHTYRNGLVFQNTASSHSVPRGAAVPGGSQD